MIKLFSRGARRPHSVVFFGPGGARQPRDDASASLWRSFDLPSFRTLFSPSASLPILFPKKRNIDETQALGSPFTLLLEPC